MYQHIPVLLNEVMTHLDPKPNHLLIDGTVGQGGHAKAFLQRALPDGRLLGIDRDPSNLAIAHEHLASFGDNVILVQDTYATRRLMPMLMVSLLFMRSFSTSGSHLCM